MDKTHIIIEPSLLEGLEHIVLDEHFKTPYLLFYHKNNVYKLEIVLCRTELKDFHVYADKGALDYCNTCELNKIIEEIGKKYA